MTSGDGSTPRKMVSFRNVASWKPSSGVVEGVAVVVDAMPLSLVFMYSSKLGAALMDFRASSSSTSLGSRVASGVAASFVSSSTFSILSSCVSPLVSIWEDDPFISLTLISVSRSTRKSGIVFLRLLSPTVVMDDILGRT